MQYLEKIGKNAKKAFEDLKTVKHSRIKRVLEIYNKSLLKIREKLLKRILRMLSAKRKSF